MAKRFGGVRKVKRKTKWRRWQAFAHLNRIKIRKPKDGKEKLSEYRSKKRKRGASNEHSGYSHKC